MATQVSMVRLEAIISRRIRDGLIGMAKVGAKEYRRAVTQVREKPPFIGPHSKPGEYPYRETGQGAANVAWEHVKGKLVAGYGVKEEGLHLHHLTQRGRKGAGDVMFERLGAFRAEFRKRASK